MYKLMPCGGVNASHTSAVPVYLGGQPGHQTRWEFKSYSKVVLKQIFDVTDKGVINVHRWEAFSNGIESEW